MVTIKLITSDSYVWNKLSVIAQFTSAVCNKHPVCIDLLNEGPAFENLDIYQSIRDICETYNYDLENITVTTCNLYQQPIDNIEFEITFPNHFVYNTVKLLENVNTEKNISKTFGLFVGRSNSHRLDLSSYLFNHYKDQTDQTFHYDPSDEYHRNNLGLDGLLAIAGVEVSTEISQFLQQCPMISSESVTYPILMDQHCNMYSRYQNFFTEVVCETSYVGETFFPTEKIWRPIAMMTPFIVQGPQNFLHRLQKLGFKTFDRWWDEGYAEDPADWQTVEIKKVINFLSNKSINELQKIYNEMLPTLEHNKKLLIDMNQQFVDSTVCTN